MPWEPGQDLSQLADILKASWDANQRVMILGYRVNGTAGYVRFLASAFTNTVQFHVQHTGAGGGGATYNSATYVSSVAVDCRSNRQQDKTVTLNGIDHYYVWLIPVQEGVQLNGASGKPDQMAYLDLGT